MLQMREYGKCQKQQLVAKLSAYSLCLTCSQKGRGECASTHAICHLAGSLCIDSCYTYVESRIARQTLYCKVRILIGGIVKYLAGELIVDLGMKMLWNAAIIAGYALYLQRVSRGIIRRTVFYRFG